MEYCLEHHGVKGMKWGVRKQRPRTSRLYNDANYPTKGLSPHGIGRKNYYRQVTNAHNNRIKKQYQSAKAKYKQGRMSESEYKKYRDARISNLANRSTLAMVGFDKVSQGVYYSALNCGYSKPTAMAAAYGKQVIRNFGAMVATSTVMNVGSRFIRAGSSTIRRYGGMGL